MLKDEELMNITGGGYKIGLVIGTIIVFVAGVIDGYLRPNKCKS
jgi:lactobin A/cerein 7B family class IIb bacteriocin